LILLTKRGRREITLEIPVGKKREKETALNSDCNGGKNRKKSQRNTILN